MAERSPIDSSIADHLTWCRKEKQSAMDSLALFEAGSAHPCPHLPDGMINGSDVHLQYLRGIIAQLGRVIEAYGGGQK